MNKINVWNAIRFAYAFTFGDIGTIIGLIWLPTLLIAVLQFLPYALGTQAVCDAVLDSADHLKWESVVPV